MADYQFKFPTGMRSAEEWSRGESFCQAYIEAIQKDAVMAERCEVQAEKDRAGNYFDW